MGIIGRMAILTTIISRGFRWWIVGVMMSVAVGATPNVHVLPNGATLVTLVDPSAVINASYVMVRTGSLFESPWMGSGISHYLEHLVSGGTTTHHDEAWYTTELAKMGGASNAYTTYDHTAYYIHCAAPHTRRALTTLYEWVGSSRWTPDEFDRERGVILKEMERAQHNVSRVMHQAVQSRYYKHSPYRYPVIGQRSSFMALTSDDVMTYYKQHYVPENLVIVVGGNIQESDIVAHVTDTFGQLPAAAAPLRYHASTPRVMTDHVTQIHIPTLTTKRVVIRYPIGPFFNDDVYPLDLLAYHLGQGDQSRLHQVFMVNNQWATNLHVQSITPLFDFGYFEIMIETQEDAALTVDRVQAVIDQLAWTRMSEAQLSHRVNQKRSDYVFGVSSLLDRVKNVGQGMIMGDNPQFFDYYSRQFSQVRANDIQRVVRHYLTPRKRHVYVMSPSQSTGSNESRTPSFSPTMIRHNGVQFMSMPSTQSDMVRVTIRLDGGIETEPPHQAGIGSVTARVMGKKTTGHSRSVVQSRFESKGARVSTSFDHNALTLSLVANARDWPSLVPLFLQCLTAFDVDAATLEEAKINAIQSINKQSESWFDDAFDQVKTVVFDPTSPFHRSLKGTEASISSLTIDDIHGYVRDRLASSTITIGIQAADAAAIQSTLMPLVPKGPRQTPSITPVLSPPSSTQKSLAQSAGVVIRVDPLRRPLVTINEWLTVKVVDAILSGMRYPGGLLHHRLRGDQLVYVVHTLPMRMGHRDMLFTYALTSPKDVPLVQRIIHQLFKSIRTDVSLDQLELAKAQVLFDIQSDYQDPTRKMSFYYDFWKRFGTVPSMAVIQSELDRISISDVKDSVNESFLRPYTVLFNASQK